MKAQLNRSQVIARLARAKGKRSLRTFAEVVGVSHVYLYDVLRGNCAPGPAILDYMGLKEVTLSVYVPK